MHSQNISELIINNKNVDLNIRWYTVLPKCLKT